MVFWAEANLQISDVSLLAFSVIEIILDLGASGTPGYIPSFGSSGTWVSNNNSLGGCAIR